MIDTINLDGDTHTVAGWIWRHLVPKAGQADTVQGELLRAVEKLRWEAQNNGNINWDDGFGMFVDFLGTTLALETRLPPGLLAAVRADLARIADFEEPCIEDAIYDRLTEAVVAYCRLQPVPVRKAVDPRQVR